MARFKVFLMGSPQPLRVELPCANILELSHAASHVRFLAGHLAESDENGVCPGVLIATERIHAIVEDEA
jgi:hypothetical protein